MTGMTYNRFMGLTRGKSKVNGPQEPKGKGNKPNGLTWQAHRHGKKWSNRNGSPTGWMGRAFRQDNVQATKGIKGGNASPRAHAFHIVGDKHKHVE